MQQSFNWLAMSYTLPVSPSANRVYVWRKLRELGAQLRQGMALLPQSSQNTARLQQLAQKVRTLGGEATVAEMRFLSVQDDQNLVDAFKKQSEEEYRKLFEELLALCDKDHHGGSRSVVKRLANARERDYFGAGAQFPVQGMEDKRLLAGLELDLDGGFSELMNDLRQSYRDLGQLLSKAKGGQDDDRKQDD